MTITIIEAPTITPAPDKPVELDETGKVLMLTAEIVRKGWCQDYLANGKNRCALGALGDAMGNLYAGVGTPAHQRLLKSIGPGHGGIGNWNDAPGRTKEEVIEALERAAYLG